jgi:two-component system nitrate/nitrite response regulator NarL
MPVASGPTQYESCAKRSIWASGLPVCSFCADVVSEMSGTLGAQRAEDDGAAVDGDARVRVLVADDHPAMRRALARLVSEHTALELVGEATDGAEAIAMIAAVSPDVALLDVRMPKLDGLGLLRHLQAQASAVRVLFISGYEDSAIIHEAISQGAAGFLSKDSEEAEICDAIIAVARGRAVLSMVLQSGVLDQIRQRAPELVTLSARERELLELAAEGVTSAEIAKRLCLSPNTVKTYWQRLYEKLGASDRANAIAEAIRRGLLA